MVAGNNYIYRLWKFIIALLTDVIFFIMVKDFNNVMESLSKGYLSLVQDALRNILNNGTTGYRADYGLI